MPGINDNNKLFNHASNTVYLILQMLFLWASLVEICFIPQNVDVPGIASVPGLSSNAPEIAFKIGQQNINFETVKVCSSR